MASFPHLRWTDVSPRIHSSTPITRARPGWRTDGFRRECEKRTPRWFVASAILPRSDVVSSTLLCGVIPQVDRPAGNAIDLHLPTTTIALSFFLSFFVSSLPPDGLVSSGAETNASPSPPSPPP